MSFWTFKEAYIKAGGQGLSIPTDIFSFGLSTPGQIVFSSAVLESCEARHWSFWQWENAPFVLSLGAARSHNTCTG